MDQITFDRYVRRAAGLLDRRHVLGAMSGTLLAAGPLPFVVEAKKGKKGKIGKKKRKNCKDRAEGCRQEHRLFCLEEAPPGMFDECIAIANGCCKKVATCRSNMEQAIQCLLDGVDDL